MLYIKLIVLSFLISTCLQAELNKLSFPHNYDELKTIIKADKNALFELDLNAYPLTIMDMHSLRKYAKIKTIHGTEIPVSYTQTNEPSADSFENYRNSYDEESLILHFKRENFAKEDIFRVGDMIKNEKLVGTLTFKEMYNRKIPTLRISEKQKITVLNKNIRQNTPKVTLSDIKIASFNVLNFFESLDNNEEYCHSRSPRGANNDEEYSRQLTKLVTTLNLIDADVFGLVEIENDFDDKSAINTLVSTLNTNNPKREYVYDSRDEPIGSDVMSVAIIYDSNKLASASDLDILNNSAFSRPPIFKELMIKDSSFNFIVGVNHFKSKSNKGGKDGNLNDGQGPYSEKRNKQAKKLISYINNTYKDEKVILLGDYNANLKSKAIGKIMDNGFYNLVEMFNENEYTYSYNGFRSTLDYAFTNSAFKSHIKDAYVWHINADESDLRDYNITLQKCNRGTFKPDNYKPQYSLFDKSTPFRSSDHDPVIVHININ